MTENETQDRRELTMSEIMTPNMINFHGFVHGGYILSLLDRVAYSCAARYAGKNVVTLSVDQVVFKQPINVGELVTFFAAVNYVGRTSMEIGIRVVAENILTGKIRHTNTCFFTMVAVDEQGKPTEVPALRLSNEVQQRRHDQAVMRKEARLQLKKQ
jgi:acyl-CoA hydrolase